MKDALLSHDGVYRWWLSRTWGGDGLMPDHAILSRPLVVIGLNPSTADALQDDPTIRRCVSFARAWGCGGLVMLNLFAFRSTDPDALLAATDPIGFANDHHLAERTANRPVLCAWGTGGEIRGRGAAVARSLRALGRELVCLGFTAHGHPRHPLYVKGDTKPVPFVLGASS